MARIDRLKKWATEQFGQPFLQWAALVPDASARRYYRAYLADKSYVVMDSPIETVPVASFISIAKRLKEHGFKVPEVIAVEPQEGFVLLSDLGDLSYQEALKQYEPTMLYPPTIDTLINIAQVELAGLPLYDQAFLERELDLCETWYLNQYLDKRLNDEQQQIWKKTKSVLIKKILQQPTVFMHRDFHCRNLMWHEGEVGVLDFQDAVRGPLGYDLISLVKDAYVDFPEEFTLDLMIRFWEKAKKAGLPVESDFADFYQAIEWIGLQRHLKILGIFSRLYVRDGNDRYLADIPRVLRYIYQCAARYHELRPFYVMLSCLHDLERVVRHTF